MGFVKIRGRDNMLEVSNELAKEIKRLVLDDKVSRATPLDLKVMMVDKGAVSAVFLDNERIKNEKFYDLDNYEDKQAVLDFERDFNDWREIQEPEDRNYEVYLKSLGLVTDKGIALSKIEGYRDMNKKWSALQLLRFLRKRAKQYESEANKELEIDVAKLEF